MTLTLRWRLSIALVAVVAIGAIVFGLVARVTVERMLYEDVDRDLRAEATRLVSDIDGGGPTEVGRGERRGPFGARRPFLQRRPGAFFGRGAMIAQVIPADGSDAMRTTAVDALGGLPEPQAGREDDELRLRTVRIADERFRLAEAVGDGGDVVQVARPLSELSGFLDTLFWVLVLAGGGAVVAALLLGPWAARATLRPVERMTRTTREIARSPRALSTRVEPAFPDPELREFAAAMNEMLDSIEAADTGQRQFVADASHELRTPLTSLSGNAAFLDRTTSLDGDGREALEAVGRDVERLVRIADSLTMLARLDSHPTVQHEPVDVDAQLRESVDRIRRVHPDHEFDLSSEAGTHLLDAELLRRIVENLLDNAGRYAPAGSCVRTSCVVDHGELVLTVDDDGPGLDRIERERVQERFHRGSTSTGQPGTGLGLAIVEEAAGALGGSLVLDRSGRGGLQCTVRLRSTQPTRG